MPFRHPLAAAVGRGSILRNEVAQSHCLVALPIWQLSPPWRMLNLVYRSVVFVHASFRYPRQIRTEPFVSASPSEWRNHEDMSNCYVKACLYSADLFAGLSTFHGFAREYCFNMANQLLYALRDGTYVRGLTYALMLPYLRSSRSSASLSCYLY